MDRSIRESRDVRRAFKDRGMEWREALRRIFDTIVCVARLQGILSINELEDRLGTYRGFFRKARFRERLEIGRLIRILGTLEVEPHDFFQRAFREAWPVADALRDFGYLSEPLLLKFSHGIELFEMPDEPGTAWLGDRAEELKKVDKLSFSDPKKAYLRSHQIYGHAVASGDLLSAVRAAAAWSSNLRLAGQLGPSQALLWRALKIAEERIARRDWQDLFTDLLRRASYVADDQDDYRLGLRLAERSIQVCSLGGDPSGVGRGLTVRGTAASRMGDSEASISSFRAALAFLSMHDDDREYRLTALFNLAFVESRSQNYATAIQYLDRVERQISDQTGPHFIGRVEWLRAKILRSLDRDSEAEQHYTAAFKMLKPFPADATVVSIEALSFAIEGERLDQEKKWLNRFLSSSFRVKYSPIVDQAIEEVLRTPDLPDLKRKIIEKVGRELERRQGLTAL